MNSLKPLGINWLHKLHIYIAKKQQLENVLVKHNAQNQMPDLKGEWSLIENINGNNSELISQSTYHL